MIWQKIGNSVSDGLFRDSVIAENQCLYIYMHERCLRFLSPVWYFDVDDAGLHHLAARVRAGGQQPALVLGQAVRAEQNLRLLRLFTAELGQLSLLVLEGSQDKWRTVQLNEASSISLTEIKRNALFGFNLMGITL